MKHHLGRVVLLALLFVGSLGVPSKGATLVSGTDTFDAIAPLVDASIENGLDALGSNTPVACFDITRVLGIAECGAAGETRDGIWDQLGISSATWFGDALQIAQASFDDEQAQSGAVLKSVMFFQRGYYFLPAFRKRLITEFAPSTVSVGFLDAPDKDAKPTIKRWLKAHGQDPTLCGQLKLSGSSRFVGVVSTLFSGSWQGLSNFRVSDERFMLEDETQVLVPMLSGTGTFLSYSGTDCNAVELAFTGCDEHLMILKPVGETMTGFKNRISADWLEAIQLAMEPIDRTLYLPLFATTGSSSLDDTFNWLNSSGPYSDRAHFDRVNGAGFLKIKHEEQQTAISFDTNGLSFQAATGVVLNATVNEPKSVWKHVDAYSGYSGVVLKTGSRAVSVPWANPALAKATPFIYVLYSGNGIPIALGEVMSLPGPAVVDNLNDWIIGL